MKDSERNTSQQRRIREPQGLAWFQSSTLQEQPPTAASNELQLCFTVFLYYFIIKLLVYSKYLLGLLIQTYVFFMDYYTSE